MKTSLVTVPLASKLLDLSISEKATAKNETGGQSCFGGL